MCSQVLRGQIGMAWRQQEGRRRREAAGGVRAHEQATVGQDSSLRSQRVANLDGTYTEPGLKPATNR